MGVLAHHDKNRSLFRNTWLTGFEAAPKLDIHHFRHLQKHFGVITVWIIRRDFALFSLCNANWVIRLNKSSFPSEFASRKVATFLSRLSLRDRQLSHTSSDYGGNGRFSQSFDAAGPFFFWRLNCQMPFNGVRASHGAHQCQKRWSLQTPVRKICQVYRSSM